MKNEIAHLASQLNTVINLARLKGKKDIDDIAIGWFDALGIDDIAKRLEILKASNEKDAFRKMMEI